MLLANRIRNIRETYNFTQAEIAERCNISSSAYGQIERRAGKSSLDTLTNVANAIGVSLPFLVDINNPNYLEEKYKL